MYLGQEANGPRQDAQLTQQACSGATCEEVQQASPLCRGEGQCGRAKSIYSETCQQQTFFTKSSLHSKWNITGKCQTDHFSKIAGQVHNFLKLHPLLWLSGALGRNPKWFSRVSIAAVHSVQKHLLSVQSLPHPDNIRASLHPPSPCQQAPKAPESWHLHSGNVDPLSQKPSNWIMNS